MGGGWGIVKLQTYVDMTDTPYLLLRSGLLSSCLLLGGSLLLRGGLLLGGLNNKRGAGHVIC